MNYARILIGGLVCGLVLNVGEFVLNTMILARQMEEFVRRCGLTPPEPRALVILFVITFLMGIFIIYVYAAIRPRYGPGPKTASCAGLLAWYCVYFYNNAVGLALGFIPARVFMIAVTWGVVKYILAPLAGAWLYKEP